MRIERSRTRRAPAAARAAAAVSLGAAFLAAACSGGEDVVVYCAADQIFAEPILRDFERVSRLRVRAVFDVEASKSIGLATTLLAERERPSCDVFWNNEVANTIRLAGRGILEAYESPSATGIPAAFRDAGGLWTGFAARARVLLVNTDLVPESERPKGLADLVDPKWKGNAVMARPLAGTTLTHVAALFAAWGEERARRFLDDLRANDVRFVGGNAQAMALVASGEAAFGLTDTDDATVALERGDPVAIVFPDADGEGTLLLPNAVAVIRGAPHPEAARSLVDYLLSPGVEAKLSASESAQIPLHPGVPVGPRRFSLGSIRASEVDYGAVARAVDAHVDELRRRFLE
jgi:iron(III) transport system substrate-binding protein